MPTSKLLSPTVKTGQTWRDNDKRLDYCRELTVVEVSRTHALCEVVRDGVPVRGPDGATRRVRIRLDRFRPTATGYALKDEQTAGVPA